MADGAADDDKGANQPPAPLSDGPAPAPTAPHEAHTPLHPDWTVSDRRGPLISAEPGGDVERFVPGSEVDAEGARDAMMPPADSGNGDGGHGDGGHAAGPAAAMASAHEMGHGSDARPDKDDGASPAPPPAHRPVWPLVFAAILGALVGAGSAALVYTIFADATASGKIAAVSSRVAALEKRPDPQAALADLKSQLDGLSGKVAALDKGNAPATTSADTSALAAKVASLQAAVASAQALASTAGTGVDALKGHQRDLDSKLGALETSVNGAQKQANAAQSSVEAVRSEQKTLAGKIGAPALAVIADSLVDQIARGKPYATQVDALVSLGADPAKTAVLRENATAGVPSAQTLLAKFQPLADPVIATGSKAPPNAGFGERLKHGLFGLVSVRRADDVSGNDLPSRVALIQADLAHDDVSGAYAVWTALPADAKAKSQAWGALAKTSVEAITAARGLQTDSIGTLAKRS